MEREKVTRYLEEQKESFLQDIMDCVRIPSVSDDHEEVKRSLHFILKLASDLGFSAKSVLDDQVGVIEIGQGDETLGILSHVDVVPAENPEAWEVPPFAPAVKDGMLWGRGVMDDKGPLISCLYAVKAVESLGLPFKKKVQFIVGTQEEVEWTDMDAYVKAFPLPDYGFTPDGEFPVCNIEKGLGDIVIEIPLEPKAKKNELDGCGGTSCLDNDGIVKVLAINGGTVENVVPGRCSADILIGGKTVKVDSHGKATHSCVPENGDNAIINLCRILAKLPAEENTILHTARMLLSRFDCVYGEGIGLYREDEYFNGEFIHRNTVVPTIIRTEAEKVSINFNMRHVYGTDEAAVKKVFDGLAETMNGTVTVFNTMPPIYIDRQRSFMQAFGDAYEEISGLSEKFSLAMGGSYAKAIPNVASWGPIFPGDVDTCHEDNERISIDSLMKMTEIYAEAISNIVLSEESFR